MSQFKKYIDLSHPVYPFFIILFFFLLYSSPPLWDPDFWWHANTGRYILEHGRLPDRAIFNFTPPGSNTIRINTLLRGYWLGQVILYKVWETAGISGIIIFRACLLEITLLLLYFFSRKASPAIYLSNLILAGTILFYFTGERPQTIVFPFAVLTFILIRSYIERKSALVLLLPLITFLWGNIHGSILYGQVILLLYAVSILFWNEGIEKKSRALLVSLLILSVLSGFFTPVSFERLVSFIRSQQSVIVRTSIEFYSPLTVMKEFGIYYPSYWILVAGTVLLSFMHFRNIPPSVHLTVTPSLLLSLTGARYMVFFALSTSTLFRTIKDRTGKSIPLVLLLISLILAIPQFSNLAPFNNTIKEDYPIEAVKKIGELGSRRIFTHLEWGGFVAFFAPESEVFIDGRQFSEDVLMEYTLVMAGVEIGKQQEWKQVLDKYHVDAVLLPFYDPATLSPIPLVPKLKKDSDWRVRYQDEYAILFIKDLPRKAHHKTAG